MKEVPAEQATDHCLAILSNKEDANYIIMYARFLCATHLKKNAFLFEDFLGGGALSPIVMEHPLNEVLQVFTIGVIDREVTRLAPR